MDISEVITRPTVQNTESAKKSWKLTFGHVVTPPVIAQLMTAGYCVVTYLLGVGDRHLDNLLLSPDGHFFHADFGYILGRDPKPFPAQMKLSREMVDGMGGTSSPYYAQFKSFCFTAYTTLRKSANLILNLFSLMVDANIPDILFEPDKAVLKVPPFLKLAYARSRRSFVWR